MKITHTLLGLTLGLAAPFAIAATPEAQQATAPVAQTSYRLTYTITEMDGSKHVGTQHLSMIVVTGSRTTVKQGSKVPVATGTYNNGASGGAGSQTQFTYLDVGLNIDSSLTDTSNGVQLKAKIEQSGIAEEKLMLGVQEPIIRQTVMEGVSVLMVGKPIILGSLDIPGTARHLDIEVVMEAVR